ncbi:MAG TPA: DUF4336 domain-containing protein [Rhizomicrobium sp.]|nr:DUF4336 domain-containing protein [Rhizomicrobium sp.]
MRAGHYSRDRTAMHLTPYVADRMWLCAYPVRMAGTRFDARMTVIRLSSGALMLHSPCEITAAMAEEISALGPVAHIVAPGNFHTLYITSAQAAFPVAKTWICPGAELRRPGLKYDDVLGDAAPAAWAGEIGQVLVQGTRLMREVAMFHRASRTLILVDLIENFTDATPGIGWGMKLLFKYVLGMWDNPRLAPEYRMGWRDREQAAESLRRILAWEFERIVLAHGDLIERNAHEVATAAWAGVLERGAASPLS